MNELELRRHLGSQLKKYYNREDITITQEYVYAAGGPVALVAHMDTVWDNPPETICWDENYQIAWSPDGAGFDDRAGIAAILEIIEQRAKINASLPTIFFMAHEEDGGSSAKMLTNIYRLCPVKDIKFLIELDRANCNDSVYYYCGNQKFQDYINNFGFNTAEGTFSDICFLGNTWDIAAVNLSIGYVHEHTIAEHLYMEWMNNTIKKVNFILNDAEYETIPKFDYQQKIPKNDFDLSICLVCGKSLKDAPGYRNIKGKDEWGTFEYNVCEPCYKKEFN